MPPNAPRLRILSIGGNAVSAFLSWRLQATNACDVTLVWKSGYEGVHQYGISFKSSLFGNERFKPRSVVRSPEEAAQSQKGGFDYVLLCVKALPDVYDMSSIIESVVTPQHTCILINTSHSLGIESLIEKRYPKNVVLSLVSAADVTQHGPSEFEHQGKTELWVGPANVNPDIPTSIQGDMAEALAMTLGTGQVECKVSKNIQQQQFERMIGPIAFHPTSVLFETSSHAELLEKTGVRDLISDVIDELVRLAEARNCSFTSSFKTTVMEEMIGPQETNSIMYQDYAARRPMEVETYLGNPINLAKDKTIKLPRIETLYALLHHINIVNQKKQATVPDQPPTPSATPRGMGPHPPRGPSMNGPMPPPPGGGPPPGMRPRGSRAPSLNGPPPPPMRRGPPGPNGYPPPHGGMPPRGQPPLQRRPSFESNGLDEFSHLVIYDQPGDGVAGGPAASNGYGEHGSDMDIRERELALRQKELALREREMNLRPGGHGPPRQRPPPSRLEDFDEEDGEDDYFDPMAHRGPPIDPDNVDMMSITSRRNRKQPSVGQLRQNPEQVGRPAQRRSNPFGRNNRQSTRMMMSETPGVHENVLDNPMMGYSSDRYGGLDRSKLAREGRDSRASSLTTARLNELGGGGASYGAYPPVANRRTSQSPATPLSPGGPGMRPGPSPPENGYGPHRASPNGPPNGRPSPPDMRQPTPRYPPGHGNSVAPQQVENRAGVSNLNPPKKSAPQVRSLTGSASASAGSGDSGQSAQVSNENSAYSSQSSLGPRPPVGVR